MALQTLIFPNSKLIITLSPAKCSPQQVRHSFAALSPTSKNTSLRFQACSKLKSDQSVNRPLAKFPTSPWKDEGIFTSKVYSHSELDSYDKEIKKLKENVHQMLIGCTDDPVEKVTLIDFICRLGLSYHFENEIEEQLNHIFEAQPKLHDDKDYDLYTVALLFRVFRQHGYKMSCDVFKKFKGEDGLFKDMLAIDVKGILSLYEAAHLRFHKEDILEEALAFTTAHLKSLAAKSNSHLAKRITSSLKTPLHKEMQRYAARRYISFYEEEESKNVTLLMFAKLDFNRLLLLHQEELRQCISWWKDLNLESKLSYGRDRIVEIYFFAQGLYFEPSYSHARLIYTKLKHSILDDTYDAYGTLEELQRFTDAFQRWDSRAIDELPDYLKILYTVFLDLFEDSNNDMRKNGRISFGVSYTKDAFKEVAKNYLVEARWFNEGYVPTFDEYLNNAVLSAGSMSSSAASFIGMEEIAGTKPFEWLQSNPKIVRAAYTIGRLANDIMSNEFEQERGHVASGVECYMKQYGISRKEAIDKLKEICENAWKDMNEECMRPPVIPRQLLNSVVNVARTSQVFYKIENGYTKPEYLREYINKLLIDEIPF